MSEQTTMIFRIEKDLKKAFELCAKTRDLTASQLLRAFVRHEVSKYQQNHAQSDLDLKPVPTPPTIKTNPTAPQKTAIVTVNNQRKRKK